MELRLKWEHGNRVGGDRGEVDKVNLKFFSSPLEKRNHPNLKISTIMNPILQKKLRQRKVNGPLP